MSDGLAGLRAKVAAMTARPWSREQAQDGEYTGPGDSPPGYAGDYYETNSIVNVAGEDVWPVADCHRGQDAEGIVALVNAAPALLDAAAWLRANGKHAEGCRALTSETWWFGKTYPPCTCGLDAVLAGLESLEGKTRE
jgi:hypothetical protein